MPDQVGHVGSFVQNCRVLVRESGHVLTHAVTGLAGLGKRIRGGRSMWLMRGVGGVCGVEGSLRGGGGSETTTTGGQSFSSHCSHNEPHGRTHLLHSIKTQTILPKVLGQPSGGHVGSGLLAYFVPVKGQINALSHGDSFWQLTRGVDV